MHIIFIIELIVIHVLAFKAMIWGCGGPTLTGWYDVIKREPKLSLAERHPTLSIWELSQIQQTEAASRIAHGGYQIGCSTCEAAAKGN